MLDSGAFSAYKRGAEVDLQRYIEFIKRNRDLIHLYINLDSIPGRPGKRPSTQEVEAAAAKSFENYEAMRVEQLDPMPVFHCGESFGWLERMLDSGADYVGLGGTVGKPQQVRRDWFRKVFAIIARSGRQVRTHGFGCTSVPLMRAFPFYSVDSTSWVMGGANGYINVPAFLAPGKFDYHQLSQVRVTGMGNQRGQVGGFSDIYHRHVVDFLTGLELDLAAVRVDQASRNFINVYCAAKAAEQAGAQMYFSTWLQESTQGDTLTTAGARRRLLSYWEISGVESESLRTYIYTGRAAIKLKAAAAADFSSSSYIRRRTLAFIAREGVRNEAS